ncbi:MAG TPA: thiamine pyrophosphate-binding protein [Acidimicrobiia bacterium]|nr:thiamine pyrophosphate-binding protein [Acidimicrobiia bacterium]
MPTLFEDLAALLTGAGVRQAAVVASVHNLALLETLDAAGVSLLAARSETGAAYLADGYARVSGEPTLVITSTGPGAGNAVGAYSVAAKDGSPVIHVSTANDRHPAHGLHDVPEQSEWMHAMGRDVHDVGRSGLSALAGALARAEWPFSVIVPSTDGPDVQPYAATAVRARARPPLDASALDPWLATDRRLLWIGGGARVVGRDRLVELAERSGAAVVTSVQGKDLFPDGHSQFVACTVNDRELAGIAADAEVCLVLGSRLTELSCAAWSRPLPAHIVRVAYSDEIPPYDSTETAVVHADVRDAVDHLLSMFASGRTRGSDHGTRCGAAAADCCVARDRSGVEHRLLDAVTASLEPGDVVVCDMTKLAFWSIGGMSVPPGVRHLFPGLLAMGFGLPAALGASLAAPDAHVVAVVGDGGLVSILSELDLAAGWPGRVSVALADSDGYHFLRPSMNERVGPLVCEFGGPNWELLAAACGAGYVDAPEPDALAAALALPHRGVRIVRTDASDVGIGWRRATR